MFGRKKKPKAAAVRSTALRPVSRAARAASARRRLPVAAWIVAIVLMAAGGTLGMSLLEGRVVAGPGVDSNLAGLARIADRPAWMPVRLADMIAASVVPPQAEYYDNRLAGSVRAAAEACPWVKNVVRVAKYPGQGHEPAFVELQADYRMPVARILVNGSYDYVDAEGFRLPSEQVPMWAAGLAADRLTYYLDRDDVPPGLVPREIHYVEIQGVEAPPPAIGERWGGDDVSAGLRLIGLFFTRPYAYEISAVDVRNYAGRAAADESHLLMWAQLGRGRPTQIRFGRFPRPDGDFVVSPERKMSYLDQYVEDYSHLAGAHRYIDLRYDELHVSID
jgi:hypothetical protein